MKKNYTTLFLFVVCLLFSGCYWRAKNTIKDINQGIEVEKAFYKNFGCDIEINDYQYITRHIDFYQYKSIQKGWEEYMQMCKWSIDTNVKLKVAEKQSSNNGVATGLIIGSAMNNNYNNNKR